MLPLLGIYVPYIRQLPMPTALQKSLLERRRLRAVQLYEKGWRVTDISSALNVSAAAVSQWLSAYRKGGRNALQSRPKTGAPRRVSERHALMITLLLRSSPSAHGIQAHVWDRSLVQQALKRLFGIQYSLQHCGRLLRSAKESKAPIQRVMRIELDDLLKKADIARLRSRIKAQHGKRTR